MIKLKENFLKFMGMTNSLLGIDIGQNSIRLAEMSYDNNGYQLEYCANFTLEHCLTSEDEVIRALKNILNKVQFRSKNSAVALTYSEAVTKEIKVSSSLSSEEVLEFLEFNIERYVGGPKDSISFDYQVIDGDEKENNCKTLRVVAVQEERVAKLVNLLKAVNLLPRIIDLDIYALERSVRMQLKTFKGLAAVISVDCGNIFIAALDHKKTVYVNEDFVGNNELKSTAQIVAQIDLRLQLAYSKTGSKIDQIILAGEKANLLGLKDIVNQRFKTPVVIANPFLGMKRASNISLESIKELAPMMLVSAGLAMRVGDDYKN